MTVARLSWCKALPCWAAGDSYAAEHGIKRRPVSACILTLPLLSLCGCSEPGAPSFAIFGAFFPAWLLCALLGILVALGLLIWLAYRGWSILLLAPAAAVLAAGLAGEPLLAHWTQTFMASAAQFVMQFFPIFLLGALFGKLMEDSGSVASIAKTMTERLGVPRSASDILNRLNEVSFNAVVLKELRMMALLRQDADPGDGEGRLWTEMRVHVVRNNIMTELGASSKLNAEWSFFSFLRDEGRKAAGAFLDAHANDLGKRSTLDIDVLLEGV